jgi:hypothetical protein
MQAWRIRANQQGIHHPCNWFKPFQFRNSVPIQPSQTVYRPRSLVRFFDVTLTFQSNRNNRNSKENTSDSAYSYFQCLTASLSQPNGTRRASQHVASFDRTAQRHQQQSKIAMTETIVGVTENA